SSLSKMATQSAADTALPHVASLRLHKATCQMLGLHLKLNDPSRKCLGFGQFQSGSYGHTAIASFHRVIGSQGHTALIFAEPLATRQQNGEIISRYLTH